MIAWHFDLGILIGFSINYTKYKGRKYITLFLRVPFAGVTFNIYLKPYSDD